MTPLRDLVPEQDHPRQCGNCWGTRWRVVIQARRAYWECVQCHYRATDLGLGR